MTGKQPTVLEHTEIYRGPVKLVLFTMKVATFITLRTSSVIMHQLNISNWLMTELLATLIDDDAGIYFKR